MASDLDVVNDALVKLGATPIASLTDAGAQATSAGQIYATLRDRLLAETPWYWALRRQPLSQLSLGSEYDEFPDYQYVYELPTDRIRVLGLTSCSPFALMRSRLHTDDAEAVVVYVFRAEVDQWPGYFREAVSDALAADLAISVTDSSNRRAAWEDAARRSRVRAMAIDAQQTPPEVINLMRIYTEGTSNPLATA